MTDTMTVKERPILFSGPMIRALLDNTKTQTRRVVKPQPPETFPVGWVKGAGGHAREAAAFWSAEKVGDFPMWEKFVACPYGTVGDRLWVRETWQYADWTEDGYPFIRYQADGAVVLHEKVADDGWGERLADIWAGLSDADNYAIDGKAADRKWRPSIFMPRWASRISLEITGIRVERLQDISEEDAMAEGIVYTDFGLSQSTGSASIDGGKTFHPMKPQPQAGFHSGGATSPDQCLRSARFAYANLWNSINGAGSWDANPWVWVIEFRAGLKGRETP